MFFLWIILFVFLFFVLIIFSKIKISIENIKFTTYKLNSRHLQENYKVEIKLYILNVIRILKIKITKEKLEKLKIKSKFKNIETKLLSKNIKMDINILDVFKQLDIDLEKIDFKFQVGTENAAFTSILFGVISSFIPIVLRKQISNIEEQKIEITPIYTNENLLNIELSCIFNLKMIHIIYIIYILSKKRRDEKYVRTSNRRSYGYSYE